MYERRMSLDTSPLLRLRFCTSFVVEHEERRGLVKAVQGILRDFTIVPLTGEAIESAYTTRLPDFEDALQFAAAKVAKVDAFVTRNKKHFRQHKVQVLTPEEFVARQEAKQERN